MESTLPKNNLFHRIKTYQLKPPIHNLLLLIFLTLLLLSSIFFTYYYTTPQTTQNENNQTITYVEEENNDEKETVSNTNTSAEEEITKETIPSTNTPVKEETSITSNTNTSAEETTTNETTPTNTPTEPTPEPEVPEPPSAYVAFYADNQSDTDAEDLNHQRVVNYILARGTNPIFHAGDVMEDGTQDSLNRFNTVTTTLRATRTFYAALGNNDRAIGDTSTPSQLFLDNFSFPNNERWYSVNYGNLHMVILDSAFAASNQTQLNWLITDLQSSNSQNKITGVMYHHPSFASSISTYLINYGVDFVIAGHLHSYSHTISDGIHYFVLSGQPSIGYITAKIYSDRVEITAYNSGNGIMETIEFKER